jgi:hypothetical protein
VAPPPVINLAVIAGAGSVEKLPTGLTGAAGEFYVAAELSLRGWLATVTIKNAPATDVLARDLATGRVVAIQTKPASPGNNFRLGLRDEVPTAADNEWYVLVGLLAPGNRPDFFIVPRNVVAGAIYAGMKRWLATPSRSGTPHKYSFHMVPRDSMDGYHEKWDLLHMPTTEAPLLLGTDALSAIEEYGLPEGHPGLPTP